MNKTPEKILFILVPFIVFILFITSGEKIISILEGTKLATWLNYISYPNTIVFNLSVGYLSGVFIYFLTAYLPNKRIKIYQDIITFRLLIQIENHLDNLFSDILNPITNPDIIEISEKINENTFKERCKNCDLLGEGSAKFDYKTFLFSNVLIIEDLLSDWNDFQDGMKEIDLACIYIKPEIYDLCIEIRSCKINETLMSSRDQPDLGDGRRKTLEFSYSVFYRCHLLYLELVEIIKNMDKKMSIPKNKQSFK